MVLERVRVGLVVVFVPCFPPNSLGDTLLDTICYHQVLSFFSIPLRYIHFIIMYSYIGHQDGQSLYTTSL